MGQEEVTCIVVLDKDTSPSRRLIESSTHLSAKIFPNIAELLGASGDYKIVAIFIDTDHIGQDSLAEYLHLVKEKWPTSPLIALTGDRTVDSILELFRVGMDEFLLKPFNNEELAIRMQVKQAQIGKERERAVTVADVSVDPNTRSIKNLANNKVKYLSPIEVNLLSILLSLMGQSISREMVKRKCWGTTNVSDNALNRKLFEVRRALSQIGSDLTIKTLYGSGYAIQKKKPFEEQ